MSDVKISLTPVQYTLLARLLEAVPRVLSANSEAEDAAVQSREPHVVDHRNSPTTFKGEPGTNTSLAMDLTAHTDSGPAMSRWCMVDVAVAVKAVRLDLLEKDPTKETTLKDCGIVRLSLNETAANLRVLSDGATETDVILKFVTVDNTKVGDSKFREMVSAAQQDGNQFVLAYTTTAGPNPSSNATISIHRPIIVFAVAPVFALLDAVQSIFGTSVVANDKADTKTSIDVAAREDLLDAYPALSTQVNIYNASVIVLENEDDLDTDAIEFSVKEITASHEVSYTSTL